MTRARNHNRGGWRGSVVFQTTVERYKLPDGTWAVGAPTDDAESEEVTLTVSGRAYYDPGICSGPIDGSYPPEGDTEMESCIGPNSIDWEENLTEEEKKLIYSKITDLCYENYHDSDC
jgi:hypothetical protein